MIEPFAFCVVFSVPVTVVIFVLIFEVIVEDSLFYAVVIGFPVWVDPRVLGRC